MYNNNQYLIIEHEINRESKDTWNPRNCDSRTFKEYKI